MNCELSPNLENRVIFLETISANLVKKSIAFCISFYSLYLIDFNVSRNFVNYLQSQFLQKLFS